MALVIIPFFVFSALLCCAIFGYRNSRMIARCFGTICPGALLKKLDIKDEETDNFGNTDAKTNAEAEKDVAQAMAAKEERQVLSGEYEVKVFVDRATHLPVLDSPWRDQAMLGSSDPYVKLTLGSQEMRTRVMHGTLYPNWNSEFRFRFDADNANRRPQILKLEVFDWDRGKKDDFSGGVSIPIAKLVDAFSKRPDKAKPLVQYHTDQLKWLNGATVHGGMKQEHESGVRKGKHEHLLTSELTFSLTVDKTYETREATMDLQRAVNWIRKENAKKKAISLGKWKDHTRPIDPHTGKERWDPSSTDIRAEIGFGQQGEGLHSRDLFGVHHVLRNNAFLARAHDLRAEKEGWPSDPNQRFEEASRMKDAEELSDLIFHPNLSAGNRHYANALIKKLRAEEGAREEAEEERQLLQNAPLPSQLVCSCAPTEFLLHGHCTCGASAQLQEGEQQLHHARLSTVSRPPQGFLTSARQARLDTMSEAEDAGGASGREAGVIMKEPLPLKFHHTLQAADEGQGVGGEGGVWMTREERRKWREGRTRTKNRERKSRALSSRATEHHSAAAARPKLTIQVRNTRDEAAVTTSYKFRHVTATYSKPT